MKVTRYGPGGYDPSKPNNNVIGQEERPDNPEQVNDDVLRQRARQSLEANRAYLARTAPTAAQTTAQVQMLTRECSALIRLLLNELDGVD